MKLDKPFSVQYQPGSYKVYRIGATWALKFVDENGNSRMVDGGMEYTYPQSAYKRAKQLNKALEEAKSKIA